MRELFGTAITIAQYLFFASIIVFIVNLSRHKHIQLTLFVFVFAIAATVYYPIALFDYTRAQGTSFIAPFALSAYYSLRLFITEGDFGFVQEILTNCQLKLDGDLIARYELFFFSLFFFAPLTTATVILSHFTNVTAYLRLYTFGLFTKLYVFSDLNEKSLALAKDICKKTKLRTIIFYNIHDNDTDAFIALMDEAKKLNALCFGKDITDLKIIQLLFRRKIEFFLIGDNESGNVDSAIRLTEKFKKRRNTSIFVWARNPESGSILDSLHLPTKQRKRYTNKAQIDPKAFKIRRINDIEIFAWNTLKEASLFHIDEHTRKPQPISILIIGAGDYGTEFLKAAVWLYQIEGIDLKITVIDRGCSGSPRMYHQCPELMKKSETAQPGDDFYDIRFIENIDIFQSEFDNLFEDNSPHAKRLRETDAVFVTLGDDDTNIRAALQIRTLFDRVRYQSELNKVLSETGTSNLLKNLDTWQKELDEHTSPLNEGKAPASIRTALEKLLHLVQAEAGDSSSYKFSSDTKTACDELKEKISSLLKKLYKRVGKRLGDHYQAMSSPAIYTPVYDVVKAENITLSNADAGSDAQGLRCYENTPYNIHFIGSFKEQYSYDRITRESIEKTAIDYHLQWANTAEDKFNERLKYNHYEYYRRSSIAQAFHTEMLAPLFAFCQELPKQRNYTQMTTFEKYRYLGNCSCPICMTRKNSEHMRWNAYMRTEGYCVAPGGQKYGIKLPRARMHMDLVPFEGLSKEEQAKDSVTSLSSEKK